MTQANREPSPAPVYSAAARHMHWVTAAVVLAKIGRAHV